MSAVSPEILNALEKFRLITEEQANEEFERWEREWNWIWEANYWWAELAKIACSMRPWYQRWFGTSDQWWAYVWIKEKRGW